LYDIANPLLNKLRAFTVYCIAPVPVRELAPCDSDIRAILGTAAPTVSLDAPSITNFLNAADQFARKKMHTEAVSWYIEAAKLISATLDSNNLPTPLMGIPNTLRDIAESIARFGPAYTSRVLAVCAMLSEHPSTTDTHLYQVGMLLTPLDKNEAIKYYTKAAKHPKATSSGINYAITGIVRLTAGNNPDLINELRAVHQAAVQKHNQEVSRKWEAELAEQERKRIPK
jgi:hypothetical protein